MWVILTWILFGLMVGVLGKLLTPAPVPEQEQKRLPGGYVTPAILGMCGALLGGWLSQVLGVAASATISIAGLAMSVLGAVMFLVSYYIANRRRMLTRDS